MTDKQLLDLKKKVDEASTLVSELKGQQQAQMKQLKDDWGCKTVEEADKKLKAMNKEIEKLENEIEVATEELEEKLNAVEEE